MQKPGRTFEYDFKNNELVEQKPGRIQDFRYERNQPQEKELGHCSYPGAEKDPQCQKYFKNQGRVISERYYKVDPSGTRVPISKEHLDDVKAKYEAYKNTPKEETFEVKYNPTPVHRPVKVGGKCSTPEYYNTPECIKQRRGARKFRY